MLYQYLGTDDDEDNPSPKFGAQSAGYATSETDAEHQADHRPVSYTHLDVYKRQLQSCFMSFNHAGHNDIRRDITDAHQEKLYQRDVYSRYFGGQPQEDVYKRQAFSFCQLTKNLLLDSADNRDIWLLDEDGTLSVLTVRYSVLGTEMCIRDRWTTVHWQN